MTQRLLAATFLLLVSAQAFAEVTPAQREGYRQFCQQIHDQQENGPHLRFRHYLRDILRVVFTKRRLSPIETLSHETPQERRIQLRTAYSRNVIFSMEAPEGLENTDQYRQMKQIRDEAQPRIDRQRDQFVVPMAGAESVDACVEKAVELSFDLEEVAALERIIADSWQIQQVAEGGQARKFLNKAMRRLDLNWEVVHFTHLSDVVEALKTPGIENVVIMSHVEENGTLVDGLRDEYPTGVFGAISPTLRTLSIYGCHGAMTAQRYQLSELFNSSPSIHRVREVYYTPGTSILGQTEVAPVFVIKSFLKRVEQKIKALRAHDGPAVVSSSASSLYNRCYLDVPGFEVTAGAFAWILNGTTIAVSHSDSPRQTFSFPCSLLDRPRNVLINRSVMFGVQGSVASETFDLHVLAPPSSSVVAPTVEPLQHFHLRNGGGYQSSKAMLVMP